MRALVTGSSRGIGRSICLKLARDALTRGEPAQIVVSATGKSEDLNNVVAELPEVPTLKERGIDQTAGFWFGFFGPPGLPKELAEKISGDVQKALAAPELKARLEGQAYTVGGNSPAEFTRMIEAEMKLREEVARANNIQPE
jgi:tripartite-type tricarboxylate transporter receptor subunit TctC